MPADEIPDRTREAWEVLTSTTECALDPRGASIAVSQLIERVDELRAEVEAGHAEWTRAAEQHHALTGERDGWKARAERAEADAARLRETVEKVRSHSKAVRLVVEAAEAL